MSKNSLRIATWNIASSKNFAAIAARLAELDIDLCALQEVSLDPALDLPGLFGRGPGHPRGYDWHFAPVLAPEEGSGEKPEYFGLGLVSRIPLCRVAAFQLGPATTGPLDNAETEPRILQVAALPLDKLVFVGNTHLAATETWSLSTVRRSQAAKIAGFLRPLVTEGPVILCGDFNTEPSSSDLTELRQALPHVHAGDEATYIREPDHRPVDFFCTSVGGAVETSVLPAGGVSDHKIVVATFPGLGRRA